MGSAYIALRKYQEAIKAFKDAIKINPDYHLAYINLFVLQLIQEQDFDQDLASLKALMAFLCFLSST
jgi:tetratricopeptide (TPR) repeat protein